MPPTKTTVKSKAFGKQATVARNVAAARDKIVEGVESSLNVVLLTRRNIEEVIEDAVARGRMTRSDAHEMIQTLLNRGARATGEIVSDIERLIGRTGEEVELSEVPIAGYDDLTAAQVQSCLDELTIEQLRSVRDYELRHANRKTVLDPINRKLT